MSRVDGSAKSNVLQDNIISSNSGWSSQKIYDEIGGGSDGVTNPGLSTDNALARFSGGSGKVIQNSSAILNDAGLLTATGLGVTGQYTLPATDGINGQRLTTDGLGAVTWESPPGDGDVVGPPSSTDEAICLFNGAGGKTIKNSNITISGAGLVAPTGDLGGNLGDATHRWADVQTSTATVATSLSTEGLTMTSTGLPSYSLPNVDGTANQVLTTNGTGTVSWATNAGGDVTGPATATDTALVRFDGASGKLVKDSTALLTDGGYLYTTLLGIIDEYNLPFAAGSEGQVLTAGVAGATTWEDRVAGPVSSTDNALVRFDGASGGLVKDSTATLTDGGALSTTSLAVSGQYTLPLVDGAAEEVLATDGAGTCYWREIIIPPPAEVEPIHWLKFNGNLNDDGTEASTWTVEGAPGALYGAPGVHPESGVRILLGGYNLSTASLSMSAQSTFTIAFWIRIVALPGPGQVGGVFQINSTGPASQLTINLDETGVLRMQTDNIVPAMDTAPLSVGVWYHYCLVYDAQTRLYVDGVIVVAESASAPLGVSDGMLINKTDTGTLSPNIEMDWFRIYDRPLTEEEVILDRDNLPIPESTGDTIPRFDGTTTQVRTSRAKISDAGELSAPTTKSTYIVANTTDQFPIATPEEFDIRRENGKQGIAFRNISAINPDAKDFTVFYCDPAGNGGVPPLAVGCWDDGAALDETRTYISGQRNQMSAVPNGSSITMLNIVDDPNVLFASNPPESGIYAVKNAGSGFEMGLRQSGINALRLTSDVQAGGEMVVMDSNGTHLGNAGVPIMTIDNAGVHTDIIREKTVDAGVRIENILHKDDQIDLETSKRIINVPLPLAASDAIPRSYVDARVLQQQLIGTVAAGATETVFNWGGTGGGSSAVPHIWMHPSRITIESYRLIADTETTPRLATFRIYVNGVVQHTYTSATNIDTWPSSPPVADSGTAYYDAEQTISIPVLAGERVACTIQLDGSGSPDMHAWLAYRITPVGALAALDNTGAQEDTDDFVLVENPDKL